jgi:hypothetical protein
VDQIERVRAEELRKWPGNPRRGDASRIRESIQVHGVYKPLLVRKGTGEILAGNNVYAEAIKLGIREFDVIYKDVDDETARKIVLVDNRSSDDGSYDPELLREILGELDDYAGTGYYDDEISGILGVPEDWDEPLILDEVPTGADWAELPQQTEARAERQAAQKPSAVKGTREIMLVYTAEEHEEIIRLLDLLKGRMRGDMRYPQIIRQLVLNAAAEAGML